MGPQRNRKNGLKKADKDKAQTNHRTFVGEKLLREIGKGGPATGGAVPCTLRLEKLVGKAEAEKKNSQISVS